MSKMFVKDFTPVKIQMRLPGLVWGGIPMEAALGLKRLLSLRYIQLGKIRAAEDDYDHGASTFVRLSIFSTANEIRTNSG
jgi:hypothetical protein